MNSRSGTPMAATFLSTQQVQDLLDVDASTIYRMAADGRLPAVRVGRQWRFPVDQIEAMLRPGAAGVPASNGALQAAAGSFSSGLAPGPGLTPPATGHRPVAAVAMTTPPADGPLPSDLATATLETIAPALGVSMVVTDLSGHPLTPIVHPAPAIVARGQDAEFTTACSTEWRGFAHEPHLAPRLQPGRFGFLCAHSFVRQGASLVAMVLAGGIAPEGSTDPDLFHLDADRHAVVLETLPRTAALLSRFVTAGTAAHENARPHHA